MSWPLSQDYNEAIQSPAANFADPDLKKGQAVANALGLPSPFSGNFADVYQVRCPDGSRWAVKCFTREVHGLRERYQEISAWLSKAKLPFTVDFSYLDKGIRVHGQWHPILKMQWVEGLTLNQFVGQYLDKPAMLEALLQLWAKMGKYLRAAKIGHCDLQHGNILLVPGSTPNALALKLIDYDGMWIPPLAKSQSGEVGHANYQHPRRLRDGTYSLDVDRFPLLLVATAMRALKADKALWSKYDNGDNLLFKESDLADPNRSELFQELSSLPDPGLVMLAAQVRAALKGPLEAAALLENAMPDVRPAPSVMPTRPSRLAPGSAAVTTQKTSPAATAVAVAPAKSALDFDRQEGRARKPRPYRSVSVGARSPRPIPVATWVGGAVALVVLAGAIGGVALWTMGRKTPPPETPIVQNNILAPATQGIDQPPPTGVIPPPDTPPEDPPVVTPPVAVKTQDEPAADKPGARVVRTYDWRYAGGVRSLGISQDGNTALALGADGVLTQFNPRTGASLHSSSALGYTAKCAALTPDGRRAVIAGGDNKIHVRDLEEGKDIESLTGEIGPVSWVDVAPNGKLAIFAGDDGMIYLWDLVRGAAKTPWKGSEQPITSVRFSPDGKSAASCGEDGIAHFWDVASAAEMFKITNYQAAHPAKPIAVAYLSDNKVFVGYTANANALWDIKARRFLSGGAGGGPQLNRAVAASPDGRLWAMASDLRSGFVLFEQRMPPIFLTQMPLIAVNGLAFAPDNRHLLVGCVDGTLHYVAVTLPGEEAAPVVKAPATSLPGLPFAAGWDKPVDPDGDCKVIAGKDALTIEVPGKDHDLGAERGMMNAPRLLRDVEGDFTAQVRVDGEFAPVGPPNPAGLTPYEGAGLVVMIDDRTYFRLERAAALYKGADKAAAYINPEWRVDAQIRMLNGSGARIAPDKPTYLRVQRFKGGIMSSVSQDGQNWTALPALAVTLPSTVKIGVAACSTSAAPFKPRFDGFRLTVDKTAVAVALPTVKPPAPEKDLRKPPTGDDLVKAHDAVKEEFKQDYAKLNNPKDRTELAAKLRAEAFASKDKPDRQYALLVEARDLAARGEDLPTSQKIITETALTFAVDPKVAKEEALAAVGATFSNKAAAKAYLAEAGPIVKEAKADDEYDRVAPLLAGVHKAAEVARDAEMGRLAASMEKLQKDYAAVQKDLQTLKEKPDDAEANLAVGKFYCFQKQDYEKGDPYLVKSGNLAVATAATSDAEDPKEVKEQLALADSWWKLADTITLNATAGVRRRAYDWYTKALPNLTGKDEERVRGRVTELTKQFPDVLSAWEDYLDVSKGEAVGNAYVRLRPGQSISTKTAIEGPIEVELIARAAKPPRFEFMLARQPFLVWQVGLLAVTGQRIPKSRGWGTYGSNNFQFAPTNFVTYTCKLDDLKLMGYVDGKPSFVDSLSKNDLSKTRTVQVMAADQVLEVQSFKVTPLTKP